MRSVTKKMNKKRGCASYCADTIKERKGHRILYYCPHESCPYTELDEYESFEDYFKATTPDIETDPE